MGIMNVLLIIITMIVGLMPIMLFVFLEKREKQSIPKQDTIKDYIEEYMKRYTTCQLVEIDSKIKKIDKTSQKLSPLGMIGIIFIAILIYSFKFIIRENLFAGLLIFVFYLFGGLIIYLLTQKPTIKKMILKDNVIELYNSNGEVQSYQLDKTNIKYNILGKYGYKRHKYINIYFNDDKYTSDAYDIYHFEPYIAFIILTNLLKVNELEKIKNLNNEDIKILQQKFIYNEELEY